MKLKVITATSKSSTVEGSEVVFGQKDNPVLLAQAVRVYRSNLRQGTSKVKTRSEVRRTKSKWYRQKGTGNARHGSRNAPIFVGGGVAHGPTGLENWNKNLNRKMRAQALRVALSMQADKVVVTDNLNGLKGKTAEAAALLEKMLGETGKVLMVLGNGSETVQRSVRNLPDVLTVNVQQLNALHAASADTILFTKESLQALEERLTAKKAAKKEVKAAVKSAQKTAAKKETKSAAKKPAKKAAKKTTKKATKKAK